MKTNTLYFDAAVDDGRGVANVFIRQHKPRLRSNPIVSRIHTVIGVHTEKEAIAAISDQAPKLIDEMLQLRRDNYVSR